MKPNSNLPRTPLGPFALTNPTALALKAGLATGIALGLSKAAGNPDIVSSTFVAVLCTSPMVFMGIRLAFAQLFGSVVGGLLGSFMMLAGTPLSIGIPVAVSLAIASCFSVRFPQGYQAAAFSALFVQAVPRGTPTQTFGIRMLAVGIAATSGLLINLIISSWATKDIFLQRLDRVEAYTNHLLEEISTKGPQSVHPGFALTSQLVREIGQARGELSWRQDSEGLLWLAALKERVERIQHLLHLVYDLGLLMKDHQIEAEEISEFLTWARLGDGPRPAVPDSLQAGADRVEKLWKELKACPSMEDFSPPAEDQAQASPTSS